MENKTKQKQFCSTADSQIKEYYTRVCAYYY